MENENYYRILGVSKEATADEIRKAFVKKNMENHPDRLGIKEDSEVWKIANDYIKKLNRAYETLSDPYLRTEYDKKIEPDFNKQDNTNQKTRQRRTNNPNLKEVHIFDYNSVDKTLQDLIFKRQNSNHLFKHNIRGITRTYIWVIILAIWFPILYGLADSKRWQNEVAVIYALISIVIGVLIARAIMFIVKWHKSKIKSNVLVTPLYFIFTELNKIRYCHLWAVKDVKNTNHYRNGLYNGTTSHLDFGSFSYTINFDTKEEFQKFATIVDNSIAEAANRQNLNDIKYFIDNDDLYGLNIHSESKDKGKNIFYVYILASVLSLIMFYFMNEFNISVSNTPHFVTPPYEVNNEKHGEELNVKNDEPKFDVLELSLPRNGQVKYFTRKSRVAPLQIFTRSTENYYVKLEDIYNGNTILTVFIRAGQSINIDVPLGAYYMKYAAGDKWYGEEYLFGQYTSYSKASSIFYFEIQGNQYSGYTVELYKQVGGNLNVNEISPSEF